MTLVLTLGEPAGIGPEITAAAWRALHRQGPVFCWIGDAGLIPQVPVAHIAAPEEAAACFAEALPVLHRPLPAPVLPGRPSPATAPAVLASIEEAVALARAGRAAAVVTNPVQKAVLTAAGFPHPGHTEFLHTLAPAAPRPVMLLACPELRVVPVTVHEPLRQAIARLTPELIEEVAVIAHDGLRRDFGLPAPRLAVAGLNPHAGEGGSLGLEEIEIVAPAVEALRARGIDARGPLPPDTMFTALARPRMDCAICLYHDQALIPLKTLDMAGGVNVTLGLSIIRTSPDHGTALDIAGRGLADASSLIAAIRLAAELAANRERQCS
ncbi:MAG: 4-hydroxythreonine-4-phosphate dehydrogenase PdxA [Rhodovarius sp.]|nr:4-hydroxythreonine-4-phosphate dehydrogenase PdxA [Rhodovarius sp.]